jgi:hypothetical protein
VFGQTFDPDQCDKNQKMINDDNLASPRALAVMRVLDAQFCASTQTTRRRR